MSVDFITNVQFKQEDKALQFRCYTEGDEIKVKLLHVQTEGNSVAVVKIPKEGEQGYNMPILELASLVLQKSIPAILEKQEAAVKKYLKE